VLETPSGVTSRERGRIHGESFAPLIRELAALRLELSISNGRFPDIGEVRRVARLHVPVLRSFDGSLCDELEGIAEGAGLDAEDVVVLNQYTDLKDLDPASLPSSREEGCSAIYVRASDGRVLLAQTWDMHATARDYALMLRVPAAPGLEAWLFTVTGCLGMTGLNSAGLGITINNLLSTDARVGVVWSALVRRVLCERDVAAARDAVLGAPLGSGHHYMVANRDGAYGIETSGERRDVVYTGDADAYVHTNHCLSPAIESVSWVKPTSTTRERYRALTEGLRDRAVAGRTDLWDRLGSHEGYPRSVCTHLGTEEDPHAMQTCGAIAMDLGSPDLWAAAGCIHRTRPHVFTFG
jgi:isopenicillin-N N-acyltransferase like protein